MSRLLTTYLLMLMMLSLLSPPGAMADRLRTISTAQLQQLMADKRPYLLINTLSPIEFNEEAIKGSVNIPATLTRADNPKLPRDKGVLLVFYCKGMQCTKSRLAARKAMKLGYQDVRIYMPGLPGWKKRGLPVQRRVDYPTPEIARLKPRQVFLWQEDALLLDVRGDEVRQLGALPLPGVLRISLEEMDQRFSELPKERLIIIIDHAGKQAPICSRFLYMKGYINLAIMQGGMVAWVREGLPVGE